MGIEIKMGIEKLKKLRSRYAENKKLSYHSGFLHGIDKCIEELSKEVE